MKGVRILQKKVKSDNHTISGEDKLFRIEDRFFRNRKRKTVLGSAKKTFLGQKGRKMHEARIKRKIKMSYKDKSVVTFWLF